jgi:hypothetical protein
VVGTQLDDLQLNKCKESLRKFVAEAKSPKKLWFVLLAVAAGLEPKNWRVLGCDPAPAKRRTQGIPRVRLAVLRPADIAYTQDIYVRFISDLVRHFERDVCLVADMLVHLDGNLDDEENLSAAERSAREFLNRAADRDANYLVPIGTQAAVPLRRVLDKEFGQQNVLFLGVTDPIGCALVDARGDEEQKRGERRNVTGVDYGREMTAIASFIRETLVPGDRPIRYLYRHGVLQDEQIAKQLDTENWKHRHLTVKCTPEYPTEADLSDPDAAYFSWHTFEDMYEKPDLRQRLLGKFVIATARRNVQNGYAALGYSSDDYEIGALGARHIIEHAQKPGTPLGHRPVTSPHFECWLHTARLAELTQRTGYTVPEAVRTGDRTVWFEEPEEVRVPEPREEYEEHEGLGGS